jgi:arabinofuranosyltransferase
VDRINPSSERRFRFQVAALVVIVLGYVAHFRLLEARIQDDAYISFRYARHLATGQGLVWNVGERVEGYTNFLWTLLMAIPLAISDKLNPMQLARAVSSFSGYATIVASFLLVRHLLPKARVLPLVAPVLLAGSWPLAINTMTGLETVFFGALLLIATFLAIREQDDLRYQGSSIVYALAALTRPEAIGLFLLTFVLVAWHHRRGAKSAKDYLVKLGAPFVAIVGAHEVFRLAYYGEFVPNTYFAKFGAELPAGMPTRSSYLLDFFFYNVHSSMIFSLVLAILLAVARWRDLRTQLILLGALYGVANVVVSGADFMIGFRYLVPYIPFWHIAATLGFATRIDGITTIKKRRRIFEFVFLTFFLFVGYAGYYHSQNKLQPFEQLRLLVNTDTNTALGKWLAESLPKDAVVVARDIGEIGHISDLPIVDMTGLTDRSIARKRGNVLDRELNLDDIFAKDPSAFVFVSKVAGPSNGPRRLTAYSSPRATLALLDDPRLHEHFSFFARYPDYEYLRKNENGSWRSIPRNDARPGDLPNTYFLEVYLRKDLVDSLQK